MSANPARLLILRQGNMMHRHSNRSLADWYILLLDMGMEADTGGAPIQFKIA